jgi:long-chain acyl-CoA synthetase
VPRPSFPTAAAPSTPAPEAAAAAGRTVARLARHVEKALAEVDLSLAQYRVLAFLSEVDSAVASALAHRLDVSRPSITTLVDGLVARGFVERRPARDDRRRVEHRLTTDGEAALHRADHAVDERLAVLAGRLDARDSAAAEAGLDAWRTALARAREALLAEP